MEDLLEKASASIQKLTGTLIHQGIKEGVPLYSGKHEENFRDWISALDKYANLHELDDKAQRYAAYLASTGAVSEFIGRWQTEIPEADQSWGELKTRLTELFSPVTDPDHAHALLRQVKQGKNEPLALYVNKIHAYSRDAYDGMDTDVREAKAVIDRQLVNYFVNGLASNSIRMRVMRESPTSLKKAMEIALREQNLQRRFQLNLTSQQVGEVPENPDHEPMQIDALRNRRCRICHDSNHEIRNVLSHSYF